MTTNNLSNAPLSGAARVSPAEIERVDAFVWKLYKRVRAVDPDLEGIATTVRSLHTVLKHLKFEAEDPESLLSIDDSAVYARQLTPILEDSEFALKQLETLLEKKYGGGGSSDGDSAARMDGEKGWTMLESRDRDMIDLIRTKLSNQKLSIDMFLDTIQLHHPSKSHHMVDTSSASLDSIKDKVDAIAARICQRKNSNLGDGDEELWAQFRDSLEQEGFSRDVLRKNQDVIRAYIRQLDEQLSANGGSTPSVRGLLEHYHPQARSSEQEAIDGPGPQALRIAPYPTYPISGEEPISSADDYEINHSGRIDIDEEKLFPSSRMRRLQEEDSDVIIEEAEEETEKGDDKMKRMAAKAKAALPPPPSMPGHPTFLSYDRHSSSGDDDDESMALMSTRELMALDRRAADLAIRMGDTHLQRTPTLPPPDASGSNYHVSNSPEQHYLPPSVSQPALPSSSSTQHVDDGTHPRYLPPLPAPGGSSPPPTLHSNSLSTPVVSQQQQDLILASQQRSARLAPDSHGRDIPLEAKWTRIPRRLVSPEVLASAGVRYEARPDFVAVLGELTRDEVADFARRTATVRNARRRRSSATVSSSGPGMDTGMKKERRAQDKYHPDKYRNWNVIEEQQQQQRSTRRDSKSDHYRNGGGGHETEDEDGDPVIYVANSHRRRRGDSIESTISELYDSGDEDERSSSSGDRDRDRDRNRDRDRDVYGSSSYSQSFPRSSSHLEDFHQSRTQHSPYPGPRRSSTTPSASSSKYDDRTTTTTRPRTGTSTKTRADGDATDGGKNNDKGTKAYPFIVPAPSAANEGNAKGKGKAGRDDAGVSPAATVMPKSILKNKNADPHVRIDPTPHFLNESSSSLPRTLPSYRRSERERGERDKDRDRDRDKDRDRDRDRAKDRDRERDRERDRDRDRDRDRERDRDRDRDRDKRYRSDRYLDRERDRDRHREKEYHASSRPDPSKDRDRDRDRDAKDRHHSRSHSRRYHGASNGGATSSSRKDRDREYHDDHYASTTNSRVKEDRSATKKAKNETLRAVGLGGAAAAMLSMLSEAAL
ncbi:hypothetical protein GGR53DRAFT_471378 [Hypoxylon sp. FL1150]|nr:hypothetical protein GGR53DRAFT_471378 [Hypoxylon sp. FL1150]